MRTPRLVWCRRMVAWWPLAEPAERGAPTSGAREVCNECFICTESVPAPAKSECLCTDRYMHTECFVKMLNAQRDPRCSVCGATYGNVQVKTRRVFQLWSPCVYITLLTWCAIVLAGCTLNTVLAMKRTGSISVLLVCCVCLMASGSHLSVVLIWQQIWHAGGLRAVARSGLVERHAVCVRVARPELVEVELVDFEHVGLERVELERV